MSDVNNQFAALERAVNHARAYLEEADTLPVAPALSQAEARERLVTELPEKSTPDTEIIDDLAKAAEGGITTTVGGRFFGFVIGGAHPAGVAADWLSAAWDDAPGTPLNSPFGCAVDGIVGEWIVELLDLPRSSSVGIVTGATMGNFVGIAAARHALLSKVGWDVEADGLFGAPPVRVIIGADAHPTLRLALRFNGFGSERVIRIKTTDNGAMDADAFANVLLQSDEPTLVCGQLGQVNTGACDPLDQIGPLCRERGAWLHIDGAFGLWARASAETAAHASGAEHADSWSVDAHKWLNTPYDGGFAIVRDPEPHAAAMSVSASYLPQLPGARDPSHFVPELSRRGRCHAIYATIRALGRDGIKSMVERCCLHARTMRDLLVAQPGIVNLNDVMLNQALFRFYPVKDGILVQDEIAADDLTRETVRLATESGECWLQTADWRGQAVMRFSVSSYVTTEDDITRTAKAVLSAYRVAQNR